MTGSLARRMIAIAALWISVLLIGGGLALDQVLKSAITRNFDSGLEYVLIAMIRSSEIGPDGEVRLIEPLGDQRFLEPYSGLYRSEEHTSELQSLMRISYAVFCLKKKHTKSRQIATTTLQHIKS